MQIICEKMKINLASGKLWKLRFSITV